MSHSESNAYKLFTDSDSIISVFSPQGVVIKTLVTQHFTQESIKELRATSSLWALRCTRGSLPSPPLLCYHLVPRGSKSTLSDLLPSH